MTHGKKYQKVNVQNNQNNFDISITGNIKGTLTIRYEDTEGDNSEIVQIKGSEKQQQQVKTTPAPALHYCTTDCAPVIKILPILFEDPNALLQKEKKSKRLDANSPLVQYLSHLRYNIMKRFPNAKGNDRPWHIELCSKFIDEATMVRKAQSLQGKVFNVKDVANYSFMGNDDRAFVFNTGPVEDYGETHITIAFFTNKLNEEEKEWVMSLL